MGGVHRKNGVAPDGSGPCKYHPLGRVSVLTIDTNPPPVFTRCVTNARSLSSLPEKGVNRRLEFELGAWFEGSCGLALVLALSQMREHGLGPFGRAARHPRRNPLDRQGRFAQQPGSAGQFAGVTAPASGQLGLRPAPAHPLLRAAAAAPLLGG